MRTVVSIGDPEPSGVDEADDTRTERRHRREAAVALAELAGRHQLVVTYGSAPHLDLLLSWDHTQRFGPELDVVNAESEAAAGYLLAQELRNELSRQRVALLLTQVRVDPNDPAFRHPTRLIGPVVGDERARSLETRRGWMYRRQASGCRQAVPEPEPLAVVEADVINLLLEAGVIVICAGGGGVPVVADYEGALRGVGAVVPSQLAAAVLARQLDADRLVLLSDHWGRPGTSDGQVLRLTMSQARGGQPAGRGVQLRLKAACRFVKATGRPAMIGDLRDARAVLDGNSGIVVVVDAKASAVGG
jgi:carbamate kinase